MTYWIRNWWTGRREPTDDLPATAGLPALLDAADNSTIDAEDLVVPGVKRLAKTRDKAQIWLRKVRGGEAVNADRPKDG